MRSVGQMVAGSSAVRWLREHVFVADLLFTIVLAGLSLLVYLNLDEDFTADSVTMPDRWFEWPLLFGAMWALPFRRIAPAAAVAGGALLQAGVWMAAFPDTTLASGILIYTAAAHHLTSARRAAWAAAIGLPAFTLSGVITGTVPAYYLLIVTVFTVGAATLGASARSGQLFAESAQARAEELERSRRGDRERALVEERARIARELHDVVAHGLSVIVVQASAAQRILDRDPAGTASALQQIEKTGRNALNEMRQVLSAIRTDPAESWQPAPGLAALDDLVAELASTGLKVSVNNKSSALVPGTAGVVKPKPLPGTVDVTAYRIVQESLTNVLKHGGRGVRAAVDITRQTRSLDLRISDNGRGATAIDQGGHGLQGMQERVEVFGGTFAAGPQPGGGFAVSVSLPLDHAAPDS